MGTPPRRDELRREFWEMSKREAVKILMLSPVYFRLSLACRRDLVREFLFRLESLSV